MESDKYQNLVTKLGAILEWNYPEKFFYLSWPEPGFYLLANINMQLEIFMFCGNLSQTKGITLNPKPRQKV